MMLRAAVSSARLVGAARRAAAQLPLSAARAVTVPAAFRGGAVCMTTRSVEDGRTKHARTLAAIYAANVNVRVVDVLHALEHYGARVKHADDASRTTRIELADQWITFDKPHGPNHKTFHSKGELLALRSFLSRVGLVPAAPASRHALPPPEHVLRAPPRPRDRINDLAPEEIPPEAADGSHFLVVVDHRDTRLYRTTTKGSLPDMLVPWDPTGLRRKLRHRTPARAQRQPPCRGDTAPEDPSYYKAIAHELRAARQVVLAGHGTGKSSAVDQLIAALPADVRGKVVGRLHLSAGHVTENQLLAVVRAGFRAGLFEPRAAGPAAPPEAPPRSFELKGRDADLELATLSPQR